MAHFYHSHAKLSREFLLIYTNQDLLYILPFFILDKLFLEKKQLNVDSF